MSKCLYLLRIISDHSGLFFTVIFDVSPVPLKPWRFNISLLANSDFNAFINNNLEIYIDAHQNSTICLLVVWNALKAYLRESVIAFS